MSTTTNINNSGQRKQIAVSKLWWVGLIAAPVAAIGNLLVFALGKGLFGIPFVIPLAGPDAPAEPLPIFLVIIASIVPAIGATVLLAIVGKFLPRPILIFWVISVIFLIISFGGPLSLPVDTATKVALSLMHVVAGVAIVGVLTTLGREK